VFLVLAI